MTKDKTYICAYKHCLHPGEQIPYSEAVTIGKKHYHMDCAVVKSEIDACAVLYIQCVTDKSKYPMAVRIITNLVFNNRVPIDYIKAKIGQSGRYYSERPVQALYGLRKLYWEYERKSR